MYSATITLNEREWRALAKIHKLVNYEAALTAIKMASPPHPLPQEDIDLWDNKPHRIWKSDYTTALKWEGLIKYCRGWLDDYLEREARYYEGSR